MSNIELQKLANEDAKIWKSNPYYINAEKWTNIFWHKDGNFRNLFDKLDLRCTVELACGHGRHAEQIVEKVGKLILLDVHAENIEASRARLGDHPNVRFLLGNGYDFQPLESGTVTGVFCYDAMVHFDREVVRAYLKDTARVLQQGGMALFHHSNYDGPQAPVYHQNPHGRNYMNYELFKGFVDEAKLQIIESNAIRWGNDQNLDRVSLLRKG